MSELDQYIKRDERLRRIHLQFPSSIRDSVLQLLRDTHPGYITKLYGPVVDKNMRADVTQQVMVVEVPET